MSLPPDYWPSLATDYVAAYMQAFPTAGGSAEYTPSRNAILLCMSVAEHETNNGRAWPGTNNFGAVQLRSLTPDERQAFDDGSLHAGDYNAQGNGVLHVDTHPLGNGASEPYPVWFAAFKLRVDGIAHFLKTLYADSLSAPDAPGSDPGSVAEAMYCGHYFEGAHKDDRKFQARRAVPLSAPEQSNVDDYARAVTGCLATIAGALGSWDYGAPEGDPAAGGENDPAA